MTEELVEGGLTRFLATFQSQDAPSVGPIRSVRPVDADLLAELGGGIFAYSGGSAGALAPVRAHSGAVLVTEQPGNGFVRLTSRAAPANLFASTTALYDAGRRLAAHLPTAPPLLTYAPLAPASTPATDVALRFSANSWSGWTWDPAAGSYDRRQDGTPATQSDGAVVTAADVVVMSVTTKASGIYDVRRNQNPLSVVTGSGACWVFRDGAVFTGTWQRPTTQTPVRLVAADGTTIGLAPGRAWIELLPIPFRPAIT